MCYQGREVNPNSAWIAYEKSWLDKAVYHAETKAGGPVDHLPLVVAYATQKREDSLTDEQRCMACFWKDIINPQLASGSIKPEEIEPLAERAVSRKISPLILNGFSLPPA